MSGVETQPGDLYRLLVQNLPAGIFFLLDDQLRILAVEGGDWRRIPGAGVGVAGQALVDVFRPDDPGRLNRRCRAALAGETQQFEVEAGGRSYRAHALPVRDQAAPDAALMLALHNVTGFKRSESALQRVERAFRTINAGNRALLSAKTEEDLLNRICQVAVNTGGYRMAWVGYAERDPEKTIRPVAWAGHEAGYLTGAPLTWADAEMAQRPGPAAIRGCVPVIVKRIAADPAFDPWRAQAEELGYVSALAAPLLDEEGIAFGSLTFYSGEPDAFDDEEARLLTEMADDLAFGIRALRMAQMHGRMIEALRQSEERFRLLSESAIAGVYIIQDGRCVYANPALARMFGRTRKEIREMMDPVIWVHPDDREIVRENIRRRIEGEVDKIHYQVRALHKNGATIHVEALGSRITYQGSPAVIGMLLDVSERVRAEQAERELRRLSEALAATAAALIHVLDAEAVLRHLVDGVRQVIDFDVIVVMAGRDTVMRQMLSQTSQPSTTGAAVEAVRVKVGDVPVLAQMARTAQAVVVPDTDADTGWAAFPVFEGARSFAGAPICFEDQVLGFVEVFSTTPGQFGRMAARVLRAFADQAATALWNVDLYRELNTYTEFLEDAIESATAEIRQAKEQTEAIVTNNPNAVLVLASGGAIRLYNPAFLKLFGYEDGEMRGRPPGLLVAPRDVPVLDGALQALMARRETAHLDLNAMRKDGTEFEAEIALAPIEDDGLLFGIVCDIRDVSMFKEVERLKDAFVANVTHELRTPITSLRLNAELMRRNPDRQDVYLDRQMRDLTRLSDLIDDLLQLSRLDQRRAAIVLRPLDLVEWTASLMEDYTLLAADRDLSLAFAPLADLPPVNADAGFLSQVLGNLLSNAINYTPSGGSITVAVEKRRARRKEWAGFSVSDTGPGISAEEQERLFERFYRGSVGRAAHTPGTGLGLSIAREIVALHHGEIVVESSGIPGEGTTFRVWLPAVKEKR